MTRTLVALAEPPWEMTTPATAQTVITVILTIVVAVFVAAAAREWYLTGRPIFALTLIGGLVCSFNEATVDVLGHCYFPLDGWIGYTAFGRGVPVWVILAYVVFFGGLSYLMAKAFRAGATRRTMWTGIGVFGVLNVLLEIPMLGSGLYVYYGNQPFMIAGFPISWLVINSLGSLFGAVVLTRLDWFFTGARQLLVVLVPFVTYMSSWVLAMPYFAVTNTDAPSAVRMIAAAVSLVLGAIGIDVLIRIGTGQLRLIPPAEHTATADEMVKSR
ncbi:hypothetical protein ORI20_07240 [Mycobacterium sp. CVI_P3]|uniref:Carotenoid biosynthesis protein n=1 Tax=Mycobacterium pinniadriaticum TaxID=2994102 RepID=A0ABT3S9W8_9MYCO|nr:hypothetical protein [Mycobacterium pinniadriaticum]MCX2930061.1 hypothetical protein [Mycobacterium pinniadriaticum]MCX2936290.1 hypothetical protein [Mycobacterium pinniadriaticum]